MSDPRNTGHGHVFPRPDGMKVRCGGPAMCKVCAADLGRHLNILNGHPPLSERPAVTDEAQTTDIPAAALRTPKLYLIFRADLDLGPGKAAVMATHLYRLMARDGREKMDANPGAPVIALRVPDELELLRVIGRAVSHWLPVSSVRDAGLTTIPAGTLVGATIGPLFSTMDFIAELPLL